MQLVEPLHICLLAIEHRYPHHTIDLNEAIVAFQDTPMTGWTALALLEQFRRTQPDLLHDPACLIIDEQKCEIYLTSSSEEIPAFLIHCRGKIPAAMKAPVSIC